MSPIKKALNILINYPDGIRPRDFAKEMWPDSLMHQRVSNQGHGAHRGKAAWLCGGSYLRKLENKGLVYSHYDCCLLYFLSKKGKAFFEANQ